jgi:hypothetical protein
LQTEQHHQHSQHGCQGQSRGVQAFYGYCHQTKRMRMMDYSDYAKNVQTGISNFLNNPSQSMQTLLDAVSTMVGNQAASSFQSQYSSQSRPKGGCDCDDHDCACDCCIRCADVVEYTRCSETRVIPISFDNETRRERDVNLQLGNFATEGGQDLGWQAAVSPSTFKLMPCGKTTVLLTVNVDCSKWNTSSQSDRQTSKTTLDGCKVAYATLRADGCTVRPLVIAVAVLPEFCGAHRAGCGCSCCN